MAGNRRGKLKEHFEGIHRNFDWVIYHVTECLKLIGEDNKPLSTGISCLGKAVASIDKVAQDIYQKL